MSPLQQAMDRLPVLDPQSLCDLGADLGNPAAAHAFLARYLELLPRRLASITASVSVEDSATVLDRALSLKVASSMVGARQLAALSAELETKVRAADWTSAAAYLAPLAKAVGAMQAKGPAAGS